MRTSRDDAPRLGFDVVSALAAPAATVWRHATTPAGVNYELGPLLRMTFPPGIDDLTQVPEPIGRTLFRSHVRLLGLVTVEWDDLAFAAIEPGRRFVERSTLLTQRAWEHERVVTSDGEGCRVTDRLRFVPRVRSLGGLHWSTIRLTFAWRHRRLRRRFGARVLDFRLETQRLVVRPWTTADRPALERLATDPRVMRWIGDGQAWTDVEIEAFLERQRLHLATRGFCLGAVVERGTGDVIGLGGLQPFGTTDDVEVGWWLVPERWGHGLATEMGRAALDFGFEVAGLERIVAVAHPDHVGSRRVMERLGMRPLDVVDGQGRGSGLESSVLYAAGSWRRAAET